MRSQPDDDAEGEITAADDCSTASPRRLRLVEIALLADERELGQLCEALARLVSRPGCDGYPLRGSMSVYDGADLPRPLQSELLDEIHASIGDAVDSHADEENSARNRAAPTEG